MDPLPQPLVVRLESADADKPQAPEPDWGEVTAYLRDLTKWIVGGIIATAGAVIAGSSLTSIGSLDPGEDWGRLLLATAGALAGFLAIAILFAKAINVFYVPSVTLPKVAEAQASEGSEWADLLNEVKKEFPQLDVAGAKPLKELVDEKTDIELLDRIAGMLSYLHVRAKFRAMVRSLPGTVFFAALGFGVFAWAANPPEPAKPPAEPPAVTLY